MSNYSSIKATIDANIKTNNNEEITGFILNSVLNEMIDSLGAGYLFKGIASPSTNPGSPDEKVFYIAGETGTYTYFSNLVAVENELTVFYYDTAWHKTTAQITTEHPVNVENGDSSEDLDITDGVGNILVRFADGHIRTKNFDSKDIPHPIVITATGGDADFEIADENGNILLRCENGQIQTKEFNSADLYWNTVFKGKKFSFMGDSITTFSGEPGVTNSYYPHGDITTEGQMWFSVLSSLCGASINRVSATGGSCIVDGYGTAPSFQTRYDALSSAGTTGTSPDFIFILGGVNDWNTGSPLGDYSDAYTGDSLPTAFIPSYRRLLYNLQTTYPNAELVALTPIRAYYGTMNPAYPPTKSGRVLNDYAEAIRKCCILHGVVCVDVYNLLNLSLANIDSYTNDKLHPKANLMAKVAKLIYEQINTIF